MSAIFSSQNTAVITGGASGIGLALAKKCIGHGMRVLVADWDEENLEAARSALGDGASTIRVDVGKTEDWPALREKVVEDFGGLFCSVCLSVCLAESLSFPEMVLRGCGVREQSHRPSIYLSVYLSV